MSKDKRWLQQVEGLQNFSIFIHSAKNLLLCIFTKPQTESTIKFI